MTDELKVLYDQVKDWATWDPPGGREWYDSITDPDPKAGLLLQLTTIVNEFETKYKNYEAITEQFTKVYQLSRKMREDADELEKRMAGNPYVQNLVNMVEESVIKQHPKSEGIYSLNMFIASQKFYLDQITHYFHGAVEKDIYREIFKDRLAFFKNILNVCSTFIDVVNAVHIFNSVETRMKKTAAKEYVKAVNTLMESLAGWSADNVEQRFEESDTMKKVVIETLGVDVNQQLIERGLVRHIQRTLRKSKDYLNIAKDIKRRLHKDPRLINKTPLEDLFLHDGCEEPKK